MATGTVTDYESASANEIRERQVDLFRSFFEYAEACKEEKRKREALKNEYDERVRAGTEKDPDFQARWETVFSRDLETPVMFFSEIYNDPTKQDRLLVLSDSQESAKKMVGIMLSGDADMRFLSTDDVQEGTFEGETADNPFIENVNGSHDNEEEATKLVPLGCFP